MSQQDWQEVKGFQGYPFFNFDEDVTVEGTFLGTRVIQTRDVINGGTRESTVHDIAESASKGWSVWGTADLDSKMAQCEKGDLCRIEYLGKEEVTIRGTKRNIKKYDVKRAPGKGTVPIPSPNTMDGVSGAEDDIPF